MKIYAKLLLALFVGTFLLSGCDIIEPDDRVNLDVLQQDSDRRVLLEEFTGHRCPNCPSAQREAARLDSIYGDNLIIYSMHATNAFAAPVPALGYEEDYRTDMGTQLEVDYNVSQILGLPAGLINRNEYGGQIPQKYSNWGQYISEQLNEAPKMDLEMTSVYDSLSRTATITVDMQYFEASASTDRLCIVITEDSLVSKQLDGTTDIEDYVHRHVFRAPVTSGFYGETFAGGDITAGQTFELTYTFAVDTAWDAHHCEFIGYVMDGSSYSVFQAAEVHVEGE